jgi:hypothetical protein
MVFDGPIRGVPKRPKIWTSGSSEPMISASHSILVAVDCPSGSGLERSFRCRGYKRCFAGSLRFPFVLRGAERRIDGAPCSVLAGWHQVRVDAQCEAWIGLSEIVRQRPDALAGVEQNACIVVAQRVHPIRARGLYSSSSKGWFPDVRVVVGPAHGPVLAGLENQSVHVGG